jgi:VanZ family protein
VKFLAWLFLAAVVLLSLVPGTAQVRTSFPATWEHAAAYLILAGAFALAYRAPWQRFAIVLLLSGSAGGLELVQMHHPSRIASVSDFVASAGGALLGTVLASWLEALIVAWMTWRNSKTSQRLHGRC